MALIKCEECGKEISDKADTCPNCGAPNKVKKEEEKKENLQKEKDLEQKKKEEEEKKGVRIALGVIILLIALPLFFGGIVGLETNETSSTQGIAITSDGVKKVKSDDFTIIKKETTGTRQEDGTYVVKGKIKQNAEGSYTGLMITLDLLDSKGKKVRQTTGLMYSNYLGNNIWEFEVRGNDADKVVTDYKISSCYGY